MKLIEQLREILNFLEKNPRFFQADVAQKSIDSFGKAIGSMHSLVKDQVRSAHPDYQALRQALGAAVNRMPKAWIAEIKKTYAVPSSSKSDPMQALAIAIFDAGDARKLLIELRKSPELRHQEELAAVAHSNPRAAADTLVKKYKGGDLERFFRDNDLPVFKKKNKQGIVSLDTAKMKIALLERLTRLHDRL